MTQTPRPPRAVCLTVLSVFAVAAAAVLSLLVAPGGHGEAEAMPDGPAGATELRPTAHPPIPTSTTEAWFVPDAPLRTTPAFRAFTAAATGARASDHAAVLRAVDAARLAKTPLEHWASYYRAVALTGLGRHAEAQAVLAGLRAVQPAGYLDEASLLLTARVAEALGDHRAAVSAYDELTHRRTASPDLVLDRLARAASAAGDAEAARSALSRLYFEHPLSALGAAIESQAAEWRRQADPALAGQLFDLELARAERLFAARRWADASTAFERLRSGATADALELIELRIAACDYQQRRHQNAVNRLAPWLDKASRRAEARYYHLSALRPLGRHDEYVTRARALVADFPESSWAAETLDGLGTHYILVSDEPASVEVFRTLFERFPDSPRAERAAWKLGWWLYKAGEYREAAEVFERAAAMAPRSDFRPPWLYWAGRAHDRVGDPSRANGRYALVTVDYLNSYYGRLASRRLAERGLAAGRLDGPIALERPTPAPSRVPPTVRRSVEPPAPPTRRVIETLIALELYDLAIDELLYAQRQWGTSSAIEATLAWVYARQGDLRRGINAMRRAYPQFMAAGGELLPEPILKTIFPVDYWDLIRKYSTQRGLDPYLVVALVAQESTFQPAARSSANAYGLMQIIPATGRRLARQEGLRFTTRMLTNPQTNVRLGTRHFAALIKQFGGEHFALASYNAGEHRVLRWQRERPGFEQDEFIDDIPFPETQNYVKRILGTAEDYRQLYGGKVATDADVD